MKKNRFQPVYSSLPFVIAATPLVGLMLVSQLEARPAPEKPTFATTALPFFATNCVSCHNAESATAGLNLEKYKTVDAMLKDPHEFDTIVQKIRTGQMPPPNSPRPDAAQAKAVADYIQGTFDRVAAQAKPDPGRVTARRLNRSEYDNSIRDLLGVDTHPADDFPQDDSGYGFDNNGDVLSLSPVLMEKYLNAAESVTQQAIFGPPQIKSSLVVIHQPKQAYLSPTEIPTKYDHTGLTTSKAVHDTYRFPVNADYIFRAEVWGSRAPNSDPMQLGLWLDGKMIQKTSYDPDGKASFPGEAQDLSGQAATFAPARIPAGEHWIAVTILNEYDGLPASYGTPNPSKRPEIMPSARFLHFFGKPDLPANPTPDDMAKYNTAMAAFKKKQEAQHISLAGGAHLGDLDIGGPYKQTMGPSLASRRLIYTCGHLNGHHDAGCARKIIANFARRAFRRPVAPDEVAPYLRLFELTQKNHDSFDEGIAVAFQAILVSPNFLFRIEREQPVASIHYDAHGSTLPRSYPISQYALATRLSYFLWSSTPDEELMHCADTNTLRDPKVLEAQVWRMLADPKSHALAENFAGQWLELRKLESVEPDVDHFPSFDAYLRMSMRQETEMFVDNLVRNDGSVLDFLDANYSFLNERLAQFYGVPGVYGPAFRKVDLTGSVRGGILTQASVLTVSSYSTRTSPVLRGKWVLENILNTPPPPPPPDVPNLDVTNVGTTASLRQQLEQHRKNPVCASCHSRMDPLGFGLENFDAVGSYRTMDGKLPIESDGTLPSGQTFRGPKELENILMQQKDQFTECLTDKLLTYALGRGLETYDEPTVKKIATNVARDHYRFSSLVLEIVRSLPFQQRKGLTTR